MRHSKKVKFSCQKQNYPPSKRNILLMFVLEVTILILITKENFPSRKILQGWWGAVIQRLWDFLHTHWGNTSMSGTANDTCWWSLGTLKEERGFVAGGWKQVPGIEPLSEHNSKEAWLIPRPVYLCFSQATDYRCCAVPPCGVLCPHPGQDTQIS